MKKVGVIGLKGLPAFGGAAAVGENIIEQLKDQYEFTVYSISSHTNEKTGEYKGYKQVVLKSFFIKKLNIIYYYFMTSFLVLFKKYDLIHLHHTDVSVILSILRLRHKVIITSHGSQYQRIGRNFKYNKLESALLILSEKYFLKLANSITCVSKSLSKDLSYRYNKNVEFIPNGFSMPDFNAISEKEKTILHDDYIVFAAGRIIPTKGCHILLKALHSIKYKGKVLIIGDLEQVSEYKNLVLDLSEGLNIEFIGLIKDRLLLFAYIKKAKFFIFPSSLETMSMMLLEVASLKTRMIVSDIENNTDVFSSDETMFFKTDNVEDLADKINLMLSDLSFGDHLAMKAFKKLEHDFNWTSIAKTYDEQYNLLLNGK